MAKFPDPTRDYKAEPVSEAIATAPDPSTTPIGFEAPPAPPSSTSSTDPGDTPAPAPIPAPADTTPIPPGSTPVAGAPPIPEAPPAPRSSLRPSPFRNLIPLLLGGGIFIILLIVAFQFFPRLFGSKTSDVTLTYWGLWEPTSVMQNVIADYEAQNPGVKIVYTMQSPKNYRARLQSAIEQGAAPDIARIHNTWMPMLLDSLSAAPTSLISKDLFSDYYPVVTKDLTNNGQIYAVPLMIDGLALYYNVDILEEAGVSPPSDWNTLRKVAFDLTLRNAQTGIIERSGVALGTTGNITHWSDILGLLILQNSGNPAAPDSSAVQDALTFYTTFSQLDRTWDETQPNDIYAFATGTVAMILAPSWQAPAILAINPDLNFQVVPAPTLPETKTAWATYWAEAVPNSSKNQAAAWKFISYLSSPEVLAQLYSEATQIRAIGEIYPRRDMAAELSADPIAGAFVSQADNYTSWYLSSKTHDEGINDELIKYYEDAVNLVAQGTPVAATLKTLTEGVAQVLAKYGLGK